MQIKVKFYWYLDGTIISTLNWTNNPGANQSNRCFSKHIVTMETNGFKFQNSLVAGITFLFSGLTILSKITSIPPFAGACEECAKF